MTFNNTADAYWISPFGVVTAVESSRHVGDIVSNPEYFGFDSDYVQGLFKKYKEPLGWDGKAREILVKDLMNKGWVRIRKYGREMVLSIQTSKLTKKIKDYLFHFANEMLKNKENGKYQVRITTKDSIQPTTLKDISQDVLFNESVEYKIKYIDFKSLRESNNTIKEYQDFINEEQQSHSELTKIVGDIESAIWGSGNNEAYREWDKATDFIFNPINGYATYWGEAKDEDIIKVIPLGRELVTKLNN